jgi:hypothetical protein
MGKKVLLSFGGAGMGGSVSANVFATYLMK